MGKNKSPIIITALLIILTVVSGALYLKTQGNNLPEPVNSNANPPKENQNENLPPVNNVENPPYEPSADIRETALDTEPENLKVEWIPGGEAMAMEDLKDLYNFFEKETNQYTSLYKVGKILGGTYSNQGLYIIQASADGPSEPYRALVMADIAHYRLIMLPKYSNFDLSTTDRKLLPLLFRIAWSAPKLSIADLSAPEKFSISGSIYSATKNHNAVGFPNSDGTIGRIGSTADGQAIYDRADTAFYSTGRMFEPRHDDMAIRLINGEYISYSLNIPFFGSKRIPDITWNDGTKNDTDYSPYKIGGCGGEGGLNIDKEIKADDLLRAGKTSSNEIVYALKDAQHPYLKNAYSSWYRWQYDANGNSKNEPKPAYEDFANSRPIFFWKDPFGRLVRWSRADLLPMAECGKPVVYLYPTKTEQVSVKLGSNIEVTKSEPEYGNGWTVTAEPNGKLTAVDGKTYPYLYWDGNGASYETPKEGFVIASRAVPAVLRQKLLELGLNDAEIKDFGDFWIPKLVASPFVFISFVPQKDWSEAAPLRISPAPDTLIRVFMDWKPLSEPIDVPEQKLPPVPVRRGFTAVEWGGLLY